MLLKLLKLAGQQRLFSTQSVKTKIGLLGVPYNSGTATNFADKIDILGPKLIRQNGGLIEEIEEFNENVDIKDFGDLPINDAQSELKLSPKNMENYGGFMPLMKLLSEKVQEIRAENRICITLGGDHSLAVG